jgi:endonuclease/exonuclease/phosphatase (EEP) superfamily protein YafD
MRRAWVAVLLGTLAAVLLVPELFGLAQTLPFVMIVAFRPPMAAGLLVLTVLMVLTRPRWWPRVFAVGLVAALALGYVIMSRAIAGTAPEPGRTLTLLSFNVDNGHADVTALARTIDTHRPDLVVLPEAGEGYRRRLLSLIADRGYRSWTTGLPGAEDVMGILILAAPSLGNVTAEPLHAGAKFQWIQLCGGTLGDTHVVAVHSAAPVPGLLRRWLSDTRALQRWCGPNGGSNILIGDFNATLDHSPLRSATSGCVDAAAERGRGLVATWPTDLPRWLGIQIDHVFTAGGIQPANVQVLDIPGSDHRALLTQVLVTR